MSTMVEITLPSLPGNWAAGQDIVTHRPLSAPLSAYIEPVGRWFEAHANRRRRGRTLSQDEEEQLAMKAEATEDEVSSDEENDEENEEYLKSLEPEKWKEQDHYKVLGLSKHRYLATGGQIKKAYRSRVLRHHPDKKPKKKDGMDDDDIFKCIKIAFELLTDPVRRRAYDSVDPEFDDNIPKVLKAPAVDQFLATFGPVFERNARFSERHPVPTIGTAESTKEEVMAFYDFWSNFQSWREFSYLDEEDMEQADNREHKRYLEKQNKAARKKRKTEDNARIIRLVDTAVQCDPRLKLFKEAEKKNKNAAKNAKAAADLAKKEADLKKKEEEKAAALKAEEEKKAAKETEKKEKEARKNKVKKLRKTLRTACKDSDYFLYPGTDDKTRLDRVEHVEALCEKLEMEELESLCNALSRATLEDAITKATGHAAQAMPEGYVEAEAKPAPKAADKPQEKPKAEHAWTGEENELLVKAVRVYPPGTRQRWETIAEYINSRVKAGSGVSADDVLKKVKEQQNTEKTLEEKHKQNEKAFEAYEKKIKHADEVNAVGGLSVRDQPTDANDAAHWSAEQQKALEDALRKHKAAGKDEKWDLIAGDVPGKTKADCVQRFKELSEAIKAKKLGQGHQ